MTFDDFWQAWPAGHRVNKKQAIVQWDKLTDADRETAVDDVTWRTAHQARWQRPDPKDGRWAIPHPFRYLRDRRFEDARPVESASRVAPMPAYTDSDWCQHEPKCSSRDWHAILVAKETA